MPLLGSHEIYGSDSHAPSREILQVISVSAAPMNFSQTRHSGALSAHLVGPPMPWAPHLACLPCGLVVLWTSLHCDA